MASDGFRFPPPKNFTGKYEDWEDFSYKFKPYMTMRNLRYDQFFNISETTTSTLTKRTSGTWRPVSMKR